MKIKSPRIKNVIKKIKIVFIIIIAGTLLFELGKYLEQRKMQPQVDVLIETSQKYQRLQDNDILKIIEDICDENEISWKEAVMTAGCESGFNIYFVGVNRNGTYDRGLFALNSEYYKHIDDECAFNPECATRVYAEAVKNGKMGDFLCALKFGFIKSK